MSNKHESLSQRQKQIAIELAAGHLTNEVLSHAIIEIASDTERLSPHLDLLDQIITEINTVLLSEQIDEDLKGIVELKRLMQEWNISNLPLPFSWQNRAERKKWTQSFLDTLETLNEEIGDYYQDPATIHNGNGDSVLRFYLFDGYGRWLAKNYPANIELKEEKRIAVDVMVNAFCEIAVVKAEQGEQEYIDLVQWMNELNWIDERWGYAPGLIKRATKLQQNQ